MTRRAPVTAAGLAGGLALATVGLQISYPPASDRTRRGLSVVTVVAFAGASTADAAGVGGTRAAVSLLACGAGLGGLAEIVGVHTGWPFGAYRYGGTLGPQPFGVPLVVPLAWTMAAWPAWRVAALLPRAPGPGARALRWLGAGWALASWDLFLDPQMVAAQHWYWLHPSPSIPGVAGIPVSNFLGWLGVSLVVTGALELLLGGRLAIPPAAGAAASTTTPAPGPGPVVGLLAGWTWIGGILANAAFFHRRGVAAVGGVAMGLVAVPTLRRARTRRTPDPTRTRTRTRDSRTRDSRTRDTRASDTRGAWQG